MKYYLIVGEASGDLHASNLMKALKEKDPAADFRFYGGERMETVGGTLVKHYRELAYMGFVPVLMHLRTILRNMQSCKQDIIRWQPDVLILVDYPGFNLDIAQYIKAHTRIPIYYYIAPKIWAWKEYRIKNIKRDVDELFSILPFETDFFEGKHHYPIHYVGNPCVDAVEAFRSTHAIKPTQPTIAILAGSRKQEIKDNLSMMLRAASHFDNYELVIAGAPNIDITYYQQYIPKGICVQIEFAKTYEILQQSSAALVTSGTATLETAILNVPQVVCYYTPIGKLISFLRRHILKVPFISLVNLIAGRVIVPELVADTMRQELIEKELQAILPGGARREQMLADYKEMNEKLGPAGASERAADIMVQLLNQQKTIISQ